MPCEHIKKLYQLCSDSGIRLSSSDLIKIACKECGDTEVCPSVLLAEYETKDPDRKLPAEVSDRPSVR